jgi:hypothetical protein
MRLDEGWSEYRYYNAGYLHNRYKHIPAIFWRAGEMK